MAKRKRKLRIRRYIDHALERTILLDFGARVASHKTNALNPENSEYITKLYQKWLGEDKKKLTYLINIFNKPTPLTEDDMLNLPYLPEFDPAHKAEPSSSQFIV
jgi:hypothetical protein